MHEITDPYADGPAHATRAQQAPRDLREVLAESVARARAARGQAGTYGRIRCALCGSDISDVPRLTVDVDGASYHVELNCWFIRTPGYPLDLEAVKAAVETVVRSRRDGGGK